MEIPLFPLHTVLCPGIVMPLHIFEDRYRALTRHCLDTGAPFGVVLIREGRETGSGQVLALAGWRARRDPRSGALPRRPVRPPGRGDRALRHRRRRSRPRAVPRRRRHAARGRGGGRGARRAARRVRDPPVRPLSRAHAGARGRDERGPRHPGRGRQRGAEDSGPDDVVIEDAAFADDADEIDDRRRRHDVSEDVEISPIGDPRPNDDATSSSRTTRPCCPTCCRASSRSSCPAARPCSRRPRRPSASRRWSACSSARSCCWVTGFGCSRPIRDTCAARAGADAYVAWSIWRVVLGVALII